MVFLLQTRCKSRPPDTPFCTHHSGYTRHGWAIYMGQACSHLRQLVHFKTAGQRNYHRRRWQTDRLRRCRQARALHNILKNAAPFSDVHSIIKIAAAADGKNVKIVFRNTGVPIPQDELESIFDKFYRLDESRSAQTGGAGLGLAIAKEIVAAHGGNIHATCDGNETVFTVLLPEKNALAKDRTVCT